MQETWVQSLGQEDPLDKEMAAHSNILAWIISQTEEPGGLQSMESQRVGQDHMTTTWKKIRIPIRSNPLTDQHVFFFSLSPLK